MTENNTVFNDQEFHAWLPLMPIHVILSLARRMVDDVDFNRREIPSPW